VATLTTLADARVLIEQLPENHRASGQNQTLRIREITGIPQVLAIFAGTKRQILSTSPVWRHIMTQLEQSAAGIEVVDLGIALRLALLLEGLEYQTQ
jgi:hypothetical protein